MNGKGRKRLKEFDWLRERMEVLDKYIKADGWKKCLRHGDARAANYIVNNDKYYLIDWEYSGNADIGYDIGHYCAEIGRYEENGVWKISRDNVAHWFGRQPTDEEYRHIVGCFALDEYYWFVWAINLVSQGQSVEDCVIRCYKNSKVFGEEAIKMYEKQV